MAEKSDTAASAADEGLSARPHVKAPKEREKKASIFGRDMKYPDPEAVFRVRAGRPEVLKADCIFVLDTNALLAPFGVGTQAVKEIRGVLAQLATQARLCVPAQVAREFADKRGTRLTEIYAEVQQKRQRPKLPWSPLLESMPSYDGVAAAERTVDAAWAKYSSALEEMLKQMKAWVWDDPVSSMYADVFVGRGVITSIDYDADEMHAELARRYEHGIPPGYKDKGKADEGIGDLLVWKTILQVGRTNKKHVLLVSGEGKSDWWHRSSGNPLYPRFELLVEFDAVSEGKLFNIVRFAEFLELLNAPSETVAEVRKEEERMADNRKPIEGALRCLYVGCEASGCLTIYPGASATRTPSYSYDVATPGWLCYTPGYPSAPNLGICPAHQRVTLDGHPSVDVVVSRETHGIFFMLSSHDGPLGRVTFPSNTLTLQLALRADERESEELWAAGRRVAAQFGFKAS